MKKSGKFSRKHQHGMTLIISLIFLVLLTILGLSVTNTNSVQTRMASNTRHRDLAFQAAEHAMQAAETGFNDPLNAANLYIQNVIAPVPVVPGPTKPSYVLLNGETHANDAYYWKETFDWTTTQSTPVAGITSDLAASQPRYTIEQMPSSACPEDAAKTCFYFRVTARGVGSNAAAASVVQTMLKFKN